jgi:uncharacterized DUF497 family protein
MERAAADFDWDGGNREKCRRHGMSIPEIEYVLAHSETYIMPDRRNSEYEPRFIAIGRTAAARYAFVAFTPRQRDQGIVWRPISARYMHRKEIAKYEKEISGLKDRRRGGSLP